MKLSHLLAMRGRLIPAIALAVALAVAVGAGASSAASVPARASAARQPAAKKAKIKKISVTVGYIGTEGIWSGPEGFAYSKGLFQKWLAPSGVTIASDAQFANGPLMTAALVGGSVQVGLLGDTPALLAKSAGAPTRLINQEELGLASELIVKPGITSLSQLVGQSVVRQQGSYMDRYVQALIHSKGLTGKINLVAMLFAQSIPAFNSGQISALVIPPSDASQITAKYTVLAKSATTPQWEGTGVTVATTGALAQDPNLPTQWNAAREEAVEYAQANAAAYYAYEAKAENSTIALTKEYFPLSDNPLTPFTTAGLSSLKGTLIFLKEAGLANEFSIPAWQDLQ